MMLCYVGKYLSDIYYSKSLFQYAIVCNKPKYILSGIKVYYPDNEPFTEFVSTIIREIYNKDILFFFRNPNLIPFLTIDSKIFRNILCSDQYEYKWLESKTASRLWASKYITTLPVCIVTPSECTESLLTARFADFSEFVLQNDFSSGGAGTLLIKGEKDWSMVQSLPANKFYTISPYYREMRSYNAHLFISKSKTIIAPITIQSIEQQNNHLMYTGCEYLNEKIPSVVLSSLHTIAYSLKKTGYTGYCGIDFLSDSNRFLFVEFNNRMQGSSALVDRLLQNQYHTSIYELAIDAIRNTLSDLTPCLDRRIYYASYKSGSSIETAPNSLNLLETDTIRCWRFQEEV